PQDFDPKSDPIVRVQAGRLRLKLLEYYETEGSTEAIRIEVPKGSYVPVFHQNGHHEPPQPIPAPAPAPASANAAFRVPLRILTAFALGLALLISAALLLSGRIQSPAGLHVDKLTRLTDGSSHLEWASISPDSKFLVYSSTEPGYDEPQLHI